MMKWTPAIETGVVLLDEQHKEIFQWLAELQSAAVDERTLFGVYSGESTDPNTVAPHTNAKAFLFIEIEARAIIFPRRS